MMGAGIVVLAMWAWFGYRGQVVRSSYHADEQSAKYTGVEVGARG